jgi:hypothetical protein
VQYFYLLLASALEPAPDFALDFFVDFAGDQETTRIGHVLQPGGDIHPIAKHIAVFLDMMSPRLMPIRSLSPPFASPRSAMLS